jgi:D-glycero-D-manno-heptose 1,7-bisphosphate phosphatase
VINRKAPEGEYVTSWRGFEFLPGTLEGLALLAEAPVKVIIATNQRGIARGLMTEADLSDIHRRMLAAVTEHGGRIDAIYHCPHEDGCACRKPGTGMFEAAAAEFGLRLGETAVVGDSPSDMEAASRIGAVRVLVAPDGGGEMLPEGDHGAADLAGAVRWLLDPQRTAL